LCLTQMRSDPSQPEIQRIMACRSERPPISIDDLKACSPMIFR
jgi:hypothetical protein